MEIVEVSIQESLALQLIYVCVRHRQARNKRKNRMTFRFFFLLFAFLRTLSMSTTPSHLCPPHPDRAFI